MENFHFKAIPTFHITDYDSAIKFYVDLLGFKIDWEHRFSDEEPVYMQISLNGLILHLSENKRFISGVIVFVESEGIHNFHRKLKNNSKGLHIQDVISTNWNTLQLEIQDPFGNLLRFNE